MTVDSVRCSTATTSLYDVPCRVTPTISELAPVTAEEVEKIIGSSPNKSCQLDPALMWLVKDMCTLLSPSTAILFNMSMTTGCFPTEFNEAIIRPRLKKTGLDTSEWKTTDRCRICLSFPSFWKGWFKLDYKHFLTPMGWCPRCSLPTDDTTASRRPLWRCITTCCQRLIMVNYQLCVSSTWQQPLTLSIMSWCCSGSSVSSVYATRYSSGSGHISVTDHSASCTGLVHQPSSSLCVQCTSSPLQFVLYVADLVNVVWWKSMAFDSMSTRTTRSSPCISIGINLQRPSNNLNGA